VSSFGWHVDSIEELQRLLAEAGSDAQVPGTEAKSAVAPDPAPATKTEREAAPTTAKSAGGTKRPRAAKPKFTEHEEQEMLFQWAERTVEQYPELSLMFAIPNGAKLPFTRDANGRRYSRQGVLLKREGLRAGVPDIFLPAPRLSGVRRRTMWHGLFVEMKVGKGKPSEAQLEWMHHLRAQGYACVICYGSQQAIEAITAYLDGKLGGESDGRS